MKQTETGPDPRAVRGKLPIGIQTVRTLREEGYRYADKTACVRRLVDEGRHYLLSRPRRFGKSFLVDTIEELFEGSEPLFRGLAVHDRGDWSTPQLRAAPRLRRRQPRRARPRAQGSGAGREVSIAAGVREPSTRAS